MLRISLPLVLSLLVACVGPHGSKDTGDGALPPTADDADGDGFSGEEDCDDSRADINPAALEVCDPDGVDEDCDGLANEADPSLADPRTAYRDRDGDGHGDPAASQTVCNLSDGLVSLDDDCDDSRPDVNPNAAEVCDPDGVDEDCDGLANDADPSTLDLLTGYADADGDTYGDPAAPLTACVLPAAYTSDTQDCDDTDPAINPAGVEVCGGADEDCDGLTDDADPSVTGQSTGYADADGDTYGDPAAPLTACVLPASYTADAQDCDDTDPAINPAGVEVCGGDDEDCDGLTDDADPSVTGQSTGYADTDGDTYGDPAAPLTACVLPAAYTSDTQDCDDTDPAINPAGVEVCGGADEDCDGLTDDGDPSVTGQSTGYADTDGDTYGDPAVGLTACVLPATYTSDAQDCDDTDPAINPAGVEVCGGADEDCDGLTDDADPSVTGQSTGYADTDGDTYGDPAAPLTACVLPATYLADDQDCDDTNPAINPDGREICDPADADEDCDGLVDDADPDADGQTAWYTDADGDGYGDPASPLYACGAPAGTVADNTDSDDTDPTIWGPASVVSGSVSSGYTSVCAAHGRVSITGSLTLINATQADLASLFCVVSVGRDVDIRNNTVLTHLGGLDRLATVGGALYVWGDPALTRLDGLGALRSVGSVLWIESNTALADISALSSLQTVGTNLRLASNPALVDLHGLEGLSTIGQWLVVSSNDSLTDLSALSGARGASLGVSVTGNAALPSLVGLDQLSPTSSLSIEDNAALVDLDGLGGVTDVYGLSILNNGALVDLSGLDALVQVDYSAEIANNNSLETLDGLGALTAVGRYLTVHDNPALVALTGLDALVDPGALYLYSNPALTDLTGLGALNGLDRLRITNCDGLTSLDGLDSLVTAGQVELLWLPNLTSLSGLDGLTTVDQELWISELPLLPDLSGLGGLTTVTGSLYITSNDGLSNLAGLRALATVGDRLVVQEDDAMVDLSGLTSLKSVANYITIQGNDALTDLSDLYGLTNMSWMVQIVDNDALVDLSGMTRLTRFKGELQVTDNASLTSLDGLDRITSLGRALRISRNPVLTDLSALGALTTVSTVLELRANTSLSTLTDLAALRTVGTTLWVQDHPNLCTTEVTNLKAQLVSFTGGLWNINNTGACP